MSVMAPVDRLLLDVIDLDGAARSVLDLAYDTLAIFKRGVDDGSRRHIEAALVMLDFLCQERLERLAREIEQAAKTAQVAQRWPAEP